MNRDGQNSQSSRQREVFLAALEIEAPQERAAFLLRECGDDLILRQNIEGLLAEHDEVGSFLATPAVDAHETRSALGPHGTEVVAAVTEKPGDRIGRYKLLQKIGEGGCGVVYMAEQEEPVRRRVALKILKLGMDTKNVIARFEAERQALAMMDHPNIARVLDAGATGTGRPYFVMELVRGVKITEYCDEGKVSTRDRAALFIQVCQAIQHAHQKGIIHRDIKPSNILVTLHDGIPVPKVIDFGIAKAIEHRLTDKTLFTEFSLFIGTPAYMSPEQAEISGLDIDTRSDIYSLGVLLYELLTGKTPFDSETLMKGGLDECRRTIREKDPVPPSTRVAGMTEADVTTTARQRHTDGARLISMLRGDLDWVVMKCLEKDRRRRYATANDLALDVQRHLDNEPVVARPPSNVYRVQKWVRRHRTAFAATTAIACILVFGAILSTYLAIRAIRAEHQAEAAQNQEAELRKKAQTEQQRAEREAASARANEYVADINLAQQSLTAGNYGRARQLLNKHRPQPDEPDLRGFEWRYLWQESKGDPHVAFPRQERGLTSMAISPNGQMLAVADGDKIQVWHIPNQSLIATLPQGAISLAFQNDNKYLVSFTRTLRLWSVDEWKEITNAPASSGFMGGRFFPSPDGNRLALVGGWDRGSVRIFDPAQFRITQTLTNLNGPVAFTKDGQTIAALNRDQGITIVRLDRPGEGVILQDSTNIVSRPPAPTRSSLVFSPDGKLVVATRNSLSERGVFILNIWDAATGKDLGPMPDDPEHIEHTGTISALAFSPNGETLATASYDYSIRLWDIKKRQRKATFQGHLAEVEAVGFLPDGKRLISASKDGAIKMWEVSAKATGETFRGLEPFHISADSRTLAVYNRLERTLVFLDLATREVREQFSLERRPLLTADFSVVESLENGVVRISNPLTGKSNVVALGAQRLDPIAVSPEGAMLATRHRGNPVEFWDLRRGTKLTFSEDTQWALFSGDSKTMACFHHGTNISLWTLPDLVLRTNVYIEQTQRPYFGGFFPGPVSLSQDGHLIATVASDDTIRVSDTWTGLEVGRFVGHKQNVWSIAFSPDNKTLASASEDSTLKLWNLSTQQELLTIRRLGGTFDRLLFSPDGTALIGYRASTRTGGLRFYDAPLVKEMDTEAKQASR